MGFWEINSREMALLAWCGAILCFCVYVPKIRSSLKDVVLALLQRKLVELLILLAVYSLSAVLLIQAAGLAFPGIFTVFAFWYIGTGAVSMGQHVSDPKSPLKSFIQDEIKLATIIVFLSGLHPFPIIAELILVPITTFFAAAYELSKRDESQRPATRLFEFILALIGLASILNSIIQINWSWTDGKIYLLSFIFPFYMGLICIPIFYYLALLSAYDTFFTPIRLYQKNTRLKWLTYAKSLRHYHLSLKKLNQRRGDVAYSLGRISEASEIDAILDRRPDEDVISAGGVGG